jgi:hypothetical protein
LVASGSRGDVVIVEVGTEPTGKVELLERESVAEPLLERIASLEALMTRSR